MKRKLIDRLTNEEILRRFGGDPFKLVNHAILLGRDAFLAGREFHTRSPVHNQAFKIMLEIDQGKDKLPPPPKREIDADPLSPGQGL
jgi:hypothetical protein